MAGERDTRAVWAACDRFVAGFDPRERAAAATMQALAERAPDEADVDRYGGGELAERLERRVAGLLGKEAAVWLPSGTMAQQIALRLHADRRGSRVVAFHPHCHLDVHEERGYEHLHGLRAALLGQRDRLVTPDDVSALRERVAAVLLELPQRDLGGALPAWEDLEATVAAARELGAALHLDGARLWQCEPFYGRGLDEIAALFDTVYVSFYKDLGAPGGCALAGPQELVDEARVWAVRHGGRIFSAYPYLLAAERGLDEVLPLLPQIVRHARALGEALAQVDGLDVAPDPPQTAMFHLYARGDAERLAERALELAERSGTWLGGGWRPTANPAVATCELTLARASLQVPAEDAAALYAELVG